jgi:hypothetical protein
LEQGILQVKGKGNGEQDSQVSSWSMEEGVFRDGNRKGRRE